MMQAHPKNLQAQMLSSPPRVTVRIPVRIFLIWIKGTALGRTYPQTSAGAKQNSGARNHASQHR